jgi:4-amino-4-deoxy-L-arabinose transferase-like glycosyltransferase
MATRAEKLFAVSPRWLLAALIVPFLAIPIVLGPGDLGDEGAYLMYADNILHGGYVSEPGWSWIAHGPGLPLVLSPLVALGLPTLAIRCIVGPGLMSLAVLAFYSVGRMHLSRRAALALAFAFGAFWPLWPALRVVRNEPLTVLCLTLATLAVLRWHRDRQWRHAFVAGAFLGFATLTRVEWGYLIVVWGLIAAVLAVRGRYVQPARFTLIVCAVAMALCLPYLAYTYDITHKPFFWSDNGGGQLFWMASGRGADLGDWHDASVVKTDPRLTTFRPLYRSLESRGPIGRDAGLRDAAVDNIKHRPLLYARNVGYNVERQVLNAPYSFTPTNWAAVLFYGSANLTLFTLFALVVSRAARRRELTSDLVILTAFVVSTFALHSVVSAEARMSVVLVPEMGAIVAIGIARGYLTAPVPLRRMGRALSARLDRLPQPKATS